MPRRFTLIIGMVFVIVPICPAVGIAADLGALGAPPSSAPRYFPREDGSESGDRLGPVRRELASCTPRRASVPTDAEDDPSYVGSAYGLGKPSYYGFRPALGVDDPFGRPLRYCP